jgi:hypothetical protein
MQLHARTFQSVNCDAGPESLVFLRQRLFELRPAGGVAKLPSYFGWVS